MFLILLIKDESEKLKPSRQLRAVLAPGSFFYPTLIFGEDIEQILDDRSGTLTLQFRDKPTIDHEGLEYAPTDFVWVKLLHNFLIDYKFF